MQYKNFFIKYFLISFVVLTTIYSIFALIPGFNSSAERIVLTTLLASILISINTVYWKHIIK